MFLASEEQGVDGLRGVPHPRQGGTGSDGALRRALSGEVPRLLGWGSRWDKRRWLGWQANSLEIAPDRGGAGQRGDQTQWGQRGSAAGQFDFGSGFGASELMGSVVVDDDGFIYVADRTRIQKFAP